MSRRELESLNSPTQGVENENEEEENDFKIAPSGPRSKSDQLTTVVLVFSTLLLSLGLYTSINSIIFVLDWLGEWTTDKFRWARLFQAGIGVGIAGVSSLGIQSAYSAVPTARQVKLASNFIFHPTNFS
jgi:hypothetical protein